MEVEKFFSKDEIVTMYLNISPFGRNNKGQNIAGVQEAAQGIFGVNAADLTLPKLLLLLDCHKARSSIVRTRILVKSKKISVPV